MAKKLTRKKNNTTKPNHGRVNKDKELEKKENSKKFLDMIADIELVKADLSFEGMAQFLREGRGEELMTK